MPASSQTFGPVAGTDGRVIDRDNGVILAGVQTWRRMGTASAIEVPHFESAANADGLVQPDVIRGMGRNKVRIGGVTNKAVVGGTHTYLDNGLVVELDLFVSKTDSTGYQGVVGLISNFEVGQDINDKACEFSAEVTVDGVFPLYTTVAAIA